MYAIKSRDSQRSDSRDSKSHADLISTSHPSLCRSLSLFHCKSLTVNPPSPDTLSEFPPPSMPNPFSTIQISLYFFILHSLFKTFPCLGFLSYGIFLIFPPQWRPLLISISSSLVSPFLRCIPLFMDCNSAGRRGGPPSVSVQSFAAAPILWFPFGVSTKMKAGPLIGSVFKPLPHCLLLLLSTSSFLILLPVPCSSSMDAVAVISIQLQTYHRLLLMQREREQILTSFKLSKINEDFLEIVFYIDGILFQISHACWFCS